MLGRFARALLALLLLAAGLLPGTAAAQAGEVRVTLFHDTHLHGNLWVGDGPTFAQYVGLIRQAQASLPAPGHSLFVGNGDDLATSVASAIFRGQHVVDAFNAARLDVDTMGNHEFDMGPDRLRELIGASRFPWVTANLLDARSGDAFAADLGVRRWTIKEVGGVRFGFTGLAPADTATLSSPGPGVRVLEPVAAMREVVPRMRAAGAQVVVLLSHLCGDETERVAAAVDGIDVAVGDHCAGVLAQPKVVNGTIVSRRGDELRRLGQLDLTIRDGRVVGHRYTEHAVDAKTAPVDREVDAVVQRYRTELSKQLEEQPAGAVASALPVERAVVRTGEAAVGNLIADALRQRAGADVALTNGGGIRGSRPLGPGPLRKSNVFETLPFANYLTVLRVTGAQLRAALENGVRELPSQTGRFPQVSGLTFTYDPGRPPGQRVLDVTVGGRRLDPAARYTLATNDFLANGGDGYETLKGAEVVLPAAGGPLMTNVLIEYLLAQGTVNPTVEGRIRAVPGGQPAAAPAAPTQLPRTGTPAPLLPALLGLAALGLGAALRRGRPAPPGA